MNKQDKITSFRQILNSAKELRAVSEQNASIAARIESEANSALVLLGAIPKHARRGDVLTEDFKLKLTASLTK